MIEIVDGDDERSIVTPCCRLTFRRSGERWTHSLISLPSGERMVESLESDPDRDNPMQVISPSYQDLHFQDSRKGLALALLVGQSGPHHFSGVFRVELEDERTTINGVPVRPGSICKISVEVAVRSRSAFESLASTYSVSSPDKRFEQFEERMAGWEFRDGDLALGVGFMTPLAGQFPDFTPAAIVSVVEEGGGKYRASVAARLQATESTQRYGYLFNYMAHQADGVSSI